MRRHYRALKPQLLRAVAPQRGSDRAGAPACLYDTLRACCDAGFMRVVLDEGPELGALARQLLAQARVGNAPARNPAFTDWLRRLVQSFGSSPPRPDSG